MGTTAPTSTHGMTQLFWRPPGALSHCGWLSAPCPIFTDPTAACPTLGLGGCARLAWLWPLIGPRVSMGAEGRGWPGASWLLC